MGRRDVPQPGRGSSKLLIRIWQGDYPEEAFVYVTIMERKTNLSARVARDEAREKEGRLPSDDEIHAREVSEYVSGRESWREFPRRSTARKMLGEPRLRYSQRYVDRDDYTSEDEGYGRGVEPPNYGRGYGREAADRYAIYGTPRYHQADEGYAYGERYGVEYGYQGDWGMPWREALAESRPAAIVRSRLKQYVIRIPNGSERWRKDIGDLLRSSEGYGGVRILDTLRENGSILTSATDEQAQRMREQLPGVIIEKNIRYDVEDDPILKDFDEPIVPESDDQGLVSVHVVDAGTNRPVEGAQIHLVIDSTRRVRYRGTTDAQGNCSIITSAKYERFDYLGIVPRLGCWSHKATGINNDESYNLRLEPLPSLRPEFYDWGHAFAGMRDGLAAGGGMVRIGIIDSGVIADHHDLAPAGGLNCVGGEPQSLWHHDLDGHGTLCAGIISALVNDRGIKGYVPNAQVLSYRVFHEDSAGPTTFELSSAIASAISDGCDIISMSLSSRHLQETIHNDLKNAYNNGVLCIAAAGNQGGVIRYPAAYSEVVAVGAFGMFGTYPTESLHRDRESSIVSRDGRYFVAKFSNFGEKMGFCAPGVAILSTVPGGYRATDGTSMACPHVTGIAALALASHPEVYRARRDGERTERLLHLLKACAQPLGFGPVYEGAGCLSVDAILSYN